MLDAFLWGLLGSISLVIGGAIANRFTISKK